MRVSTSDLFTGLHILGQLTQCAERKLIAAEVFNRRLHELVVEHGLRSLGSVSYSFEAGGGFTSIICLSESHIAVHTWPEFLYVTLDVYLCNYSRDNEDRCRIIFKTIADFFEPRSVEQREIKR